MRQPSDRKPFYAHWTAQLKAIRGFRTVREAIDDGRKVEAIPDEPQCGFYERRMIRGGPWVPARIFLEQQVDKSGDLVGPEVVKCQIGADYYDPESQWSWLSNRPISQAAYKLAIARRQWSQSVIARIPDPDVRVDFLTCVPPMLKKKRVRR